VEGVLLLDARRGEVVPKRIVSAAAAAFLFAGSSAAAGELAPAGAQAVLTVEYVYQSEGSTAQAEQSSRWRRRRVTSLSVELVAEPAAPTPMLHTRADASAKLQRPATPEAQRAMEAALARCRDDADCLAAEIMKLNEAGMGARYQRWHPERQRGSYQVDESEHVEVVDLGCPASKCISDVTRTGRGSAPEPTLPGVPPAGIAAAELDLAGGSLALRLPAPLARLPVTKLVTSNASSGSPAGTFSEDVFFAPDVPNEALRIVVPLAGDWRSQSGENLVKLGKGAEAGTLTARWRFSAR
jgi:hypothetical protein